MSSKKAVKQKRKPKVEKPPVLRGLKSMVFRLLAKESKNGNDLGRLDEPEVFTRTTEAIVKAWPMSQWTQNPKIHYAYYKSKYKSQCHLVS